MWKSNQKILFLLQIFLLKSSPCWLTSAKFHHWGHTIVLLSLGLWKGFLIYGFLLWHHWQSSPYVLYTFAPNVCSTESYNYRSCSTLLNNMYSVRTPKRTLTLSDVILCKKNSWAKFTRFRKAYQHSVQLYNEDYSKKFCITYTYLTNRIIIRSKVWV